MSDSIINQIRVELSREQKFEKIHNLVEGFRLSEEQMRRIMTVMESEMKLGLSKDAEDRKRSSLQMENTFIHETIDGTEHGDYLALDLGGTNLRVLYVQIRKGVVVDSKLHGYEIPANVLEGTGEALMDYIAECVAVLIDKEKIYSENPIPLGFTFSFPMVQKSLNSALLKTWTKKFHCTNTVNEDVVMMLEEAFERRGDVNVHVDAILNDTVGTLMTGAYEDHECFIGLILGTGSNASYMEDVERVEKWEGQAPGAKEIIDIEWGAFGDNGVLDWMKTRYDFVLDQQSNHKGSFTFEKLFGGLYLGEITRLVLRDLIKHGLIFNNQSPSALSWVHKFRAFSTRYVSEIECEMPDETDRTQAILENLGLEQIQPDDLLIVKYLSALVSNRAAKVVASALCVLLRHIAKPRVTIAVDGSLFEHHPNLKNQMETYLGYLQTDTKAHLIKVKDGSGLGAALTAAVADRMERTGLIHLEHFHHKQANNNTGGNRNGTPGSQPGIVATNPSPERDQGNKTDLVELVIRPNMDKMKK